MKKYDYLLNLTCFLLVLYEQFYGLFFYNSYVVKLNFIVISAINVLWVFNMYLCKRNRLNISKISIVKILWCLYESLYISLKYFFNITSWMSIWGMIVAILICSIMKNNQERKETARDNTKNTGDGTKPLKKGDFEQ